ncbi:Bestrophin, RFP-TM, chloride channel-domain-containing protein [Infundibulicybe gibba]|nr:Bestrophin, RFP-TM, chloride channel-domain-containing protein [Infundibulicybe gibba]
MQTPEPEKPSHPRRNRGLRVPDPYVPRPRAHTFAQTSMLHAVLATAMFRCWNTLAFFCAWAVLITVLNHQGHTLTIQPTLLTIGTVLGFVISYRTTSAFERYNEGRQLWSQIILASRTFARIVGFMSLVYHPSTETVCSGEMKSRSMIEKKTAINLLEAYAVAVKHYLRGEDEIYYEDLYYLVKFLPAYALPAGIPATQGHSLHESEYARHSKSSSSEQGSFLNQRTSQLPFPATTPSPQGTMFRDQRTIPRKQDKVILTQEGERSLFPAHMPPEHHLFDLFPFSLLAGALTRRGKEVSGRKAARLRARNRGMHSSTVSHDIPLEISLYLSSYISSLQTRNIGDVPTINTLMSALEQLVHGLTGLERILTTPIPFSYSFHLWAVTVIYCLALPFQIYDTLNWLTIPGTIIPSFIFFGFLAAGEEIENPFGYDKNDLNLDHFTHNIIRNELRAITSTPPPALAQWAFAPENDLVFESTPEPGKTQGGRVTPEEWIERGSVEIEKVLTM